MPLNSDKCREAEAMVPDDLKPVFRQLVEEYEYLTTLHYRKGYVAYRVLADLVLAGWRPSADARPTSKV